MSRIGRGIQQQVIRGSGGQLGAYAKNIGPQPPALLLVFTAPPISVNLATGLLTGQRRAQQRRTFQSLRLPHGCFETHLGDDTESGSGASAIKNTASFATAIIPAQAFTASAIAAYVRNPGGADAPLTLAIYSDVSGLPGALLASANIPQASIGASDAFVKAAITPTTLQMGVRYWIVLSSTSTISYAWNYWTSNDVFSAAPGPRANNFGSGWSPVAGDPLGTGGVAYLTQQDGTGTSTMLGPHPPIAQSDAPFSGYYHPRQGVISVTTFGAQSRRQTEARRFPLQGWEQDSALEGTTSTTVFATGTLGSFSDPIGKSFAQQQLAQGFVHVRGVVTAVALPILRHLSPTDNVFLEIQADSGGVPSGTVLATSNSIAASSFPTAFPPAPTTFTFPATEITQNFWIVARRDGAFDSTNFCNWVETQSLSSEGKYAALSGGWALTFPSLSASVTYTPFAPQALYQRRFLGPRPPTVLLPLPTQPQQTVSVTTAVRASRPRKTTYDLFGFIPQVSAQPPPPIQVNLATGLYTNQRRVQQRRPDSFCTRSPYLSPLAVVTTPGQLAVATHATRTRPRPIRSSLPLTIVAASTFIAPPVSVNLQDNRVRGFGRRHFPSAVLNPPTVLQTFAGPRVTLAHTRPRPFAARYITPATLEPEAVFLAERQPRILLVRTRPRHTQGTKLSYVAYPATSKIAVALTRTRPRPTHVAQRGLIFYAVADTTLLAQNVRTRPRPTTKFVAPPATLQPYSVTIAEDTVRVALARNRPRPTARHLAPPTVLQVFTGPAAPFVRTRPRPTQHRLTAITYPASSTIRVALARTRPRPTSRTLGPLVFYAQTSEITATLVRTRPRHTVATIRPPAVTAVAQAFYGPTVLVARTRPRRVASKLAPPVFYAATSEITVTAVRTRPRSTRHLLTAITYPQAGVGFQHLARTRPRPTTRFLAPPTTLQTFGPPVEVEIAVRVPADDRARRKARSFQIQPVTYAATSEIAVTLTRSRPRPTRRILTAVTYPATSEITVALVRARSRPLTRYVAPPATLQPYAVTLAEDTIRVAAVRMRPRHTLGTKLVPPTALRTFAGPAVTLTRTRPRPTLRRLAPPTVIRVPSVEQREQTITVALVHTRPRPTETFLIPPVVRTFPPVVTTLLPAHVIKTRPRPTTRFLRPPTVVIPLPTLRMQTLTVAAVRTRPRPTRHSLTPLAFYKQTSKIQVVLARTRPRPTTKRLAPPIFYKQTGEIQATLARVRPRPTRRFLAPPTVLQTFGPPVEVEIAVRTPLEDRARRRPRSFAIQPVTYAATGELAVTLARTRPRPTGHRLGLPTALSTFQGPAATLARTRPRTPRSFLRAPAAARAFVAAPVIVTVTRTRPRPSAALVAAPTQLRSVETTIRVALTRTRPRHVQSQLTAAAVVTRPPTVTTLTVVVTRTRPRPTRSLLAAPATLRRAVVFIAEPIRVTTVTTRPPRTRAEFVGPFRLVSLCGWTSGEVVAATDSAGSSILVSGTRGGAVVVASTESEVKPVAESRGEDSATGRTEGMDKLAGT